MIIHRTIFTIEKDDFLKKKNLTTKIFSEF